MSLGDKVLTIQAIGVKVFSVDKLPDEDLEAIAAAEVPTEYASLNDELSA